ncbi:MAG: hypothetical protein AAB857_03465 [Patescibacteria group bacterium]
MDFIILTYLMLMNYRHKTLALAYRARQAMMKKDAGSLTSRTFLIWFLNQILPSAITNLAV